MITHERLKELIEQNATIYFVYNGSVDLKEGKYKDDFILNETYVSIYWSTRSHQVEYENLFETKEEAEWHKEFGCIERTERLELPTWEEWQKDDEFDFLDKDGFSWDTYITGDNEIIMANGWEHFTFENNKEGYLLACRKAKELFLGESE